MALRNRRRPAVTTWLPGTLLAAVLACAYLLAAPASADLAAADYRGALFSRTGFSLWDNGWYAGHHLPGYSVLAPALGALLSPRLVGALSLVAATALFGVLAARMMGRGAAHWATPTFAVCMSAELLAGRVPFALGVACGMGALVALSAGRTAPALGAALVTSLASPVAGFFLALAGGALAVAQRRPAPRSGLVAPGRVGAMVLIAGASLPVLALGVAFPEGGYEPFDFHDLWPALVVASAVAAAVGREGDGPGRQAWLVGSGLYGLACVAAFAVHSPLGANVTRLGPLVGVALIVAALGPHRRRWAIAAAAAGLVWALATPVHDLVLVQGDPSVQAGYYRPLLAELSVRGGGAPLRIEIPPTAAHWEAARVAGRVALARGWERQLDTRDARLFYAPGLSAAAYRRWLQANAVDYVALPDVRLDYSARAEARLIEAGLPFLRPVWHTRQWRLYAVRGAAPLVSLPGIAPALGSDSFAFSAPRPGSYAVAVRFTPYWMLTAGRGCVAPGAGGWTRVTVPAAQQVRVGIGFSPARILAHGPRCR